LCKQPAYYHYEKIDMDEPIFRIRNIGHSEVKQLLDHELIKGYEVKRTDHGS